MVRRPARGVDSRRARRGARGLLAPLLALLATAGCRVAYAPAVDAHAVVVVRDVGFDGPESALHDARRDHYLVSNMNGLPHLRDGDGFISRVAPSGRVLELKWIDGRRDGVSLNAPKGMAVVDDTLYVADIDVVRRFDAVGGAPRGAVPIPGATFLNDVAADRAGNVYVSDTGARIVVLVPVRSDTDAVWRISPDGAVSRLARGRELGQPNGLAVLEGGELAVAALSGELYRISPAGRRTPIGAAPASYLDGLVALGDGSLLVSCLGDSLIYRVASARFRPVVANLTTPADIGFDHGRRRLLVPSYLGDRLTIIPLRPGYSGLTE